MAIVLPNGDFENSSLGYLRNYVRDIADVLAIIKLPQETFIPSGTGVKTSILFLKKKNGKESNNANKVFYAQITKIGYAGNKNGSLIYKKDKTGNIIKNENGTLQIDEDITSVVSSYLKYSTSNFCDESENIFTLDIGDTDYKRLDFEFYKPSYRRIEKYLLQKGAYRLGELVNIKKAKSKKLDQKDLLVNYVELSDISAQYNEIINSSEQFVYELPSRASYELCEGEIITSVAGNSIGTVNHASAYVTKEYEGCICTNGFRVFNVNEKIINPFYLLYYLKSKYFLDQIFRFRTGAAIPSLLDKDLLNILILLPDMNEQNRIGNIIKNGFEERKRYQELIKNVKTNF